MSLAVLLYDKKGMALPLTLMLVAVLALLGGTALLTTTTDIKIGGNYRIGEQAFYSAQAGLEEARARLKADADNPLNDSFPDQVAWKAYIGTMAKAQERGWDPNDSAHTRYGSLQSDLGYTIQISHQTDETGQIMYWGDMDGDAVNERNASAGENIYMVTSYGSSEGAMEAVQAQMTRLPPITVPSALYVEDTTTIQGNGTQVVGSDPCGGNDRPAVVTTEDEGSVTVGGDPRIVGAGGSEPSISYNGTNMDVQSIVDSFKNFADFAYAVNSTTHTASSSPGPGDGWGNPAPGATPAAPSSCDYSSIVHYDAGGTYVRLGGGVSGCGILLVEGDLDIEGDFTWHGVVVVTGSVFFSGDGNRQITGGVIAGGSAVLDIVGGNTSIVYCSSAITDQTRNRPVRILTWKEDM